MVYIGIDPGGSGGGLAAFTDSGACWAVKMPDSPHGIWDAIQHALSLDPEGAYAALEEVHAMPKQGVTSTFRFGDNFGQLKMALAGAGVSHELIRPQSWQKALQIKKISKKGGENKNTYQRRWKNHLKDEAQRLFPDIKVTLAKSDALLLAVYAKHSCPFG